MKLHILDSKTIDNRNWYLCKGNLLEYLKELKDDFYDFAIQRKIVKNQYLDKLYTTIKQGDPIPLITLTSPKNTFENIINNEYHINLAEVEILDGLQRSFRLWTYLNVAEAYHQANNPDPRNFARQIREEKPLFFDTGVISTKLIKSLIESEEINNIQISFSKYDIYFTIWAGLTEKELIQKMLVLNAGQKSVSKTHQFELLFLHFYNSIENSFSDDIILLREKDKEATNLRNGIRKNGQFMFSSIIVSLQSFVEGKPLRVSTEKLIENELSTEEESSVEIYDIVFNSNFIIQYLRILLELDVCISSSSDLGIGWFSKDTTLSGILAGVGKFINVSSFTNENQLIQETQDVFRKLEDKVQNYGYKLEQFTEEYNNLSSRSVNIGTFIRTVIMNYTLSLLNNERPLWSELFSKLKEK
ncbi:hypothetical protein E2605_03060 [Dysgonomonas capnocytophagoides]|uniref:DUF262 domain-containing protein n=1 Tax=Dysgonomonas capnocytophagoides TaxID=45254 RepID=A0A4Y8L8W0_9BACT|nr:hypothetical protein [Dysgonomonas capnocytophagoides]TFD99075.1 hypothetical protein E2605_03060 [Dysgonomonas capnocytophagoides]